jgi:hypothetical protein
VVAESRGWLSLSMSGVRQPTVVLVAGRADPQLFPLPRPASPGRGIAVEVGGVAGRLEDRGESAGALVSWQPGGAPPLHVLVYGTGDLAGDALRVARSVRPDAGSRLWICARFGWLPPAWTAAAGESIFQVVGNADGHGSAAT